MKINASTLLLAGLPILLAGCLQDGPRNGPAQGMEINNSDPDKEDYRPDAKQEKKDVYLGPVAPVASSSDSSSAVSARTSVVDDGYVGVIPNTKEGYDNCPEANRVWFYMDDEDGNSSSSVSMSNSGWSLPWGVNDGDKANTKMFFCKVNGNTLRPLAGGSANDYVVLRLGDACPSGGYPFAVHVDNEDNSNRNSNSGNIYPSTQNRGDGWTRWQLCFIPADPLSAPAPLPALTSPRFDGTLYTLSDYSVFANPASTYFPQHGEVRVDEEDEWFTSSVHKFIWPTSPVMPDAYKTRIQSIINLPGATYMKFLFGKKP